MIALSLASFALPAYGDADQSTSLQAPEQAAGGSIPEADIEEEQQAWKPRKLGDIWTSYNEKPKLDHWLEYAEHYEHHFPPADGKTTRKLLEIGVQSGGSARAWRQYFGQALRYTGVDINPMAKRSESPSEGIRIEIGSQLDGDFLREVCAKHGPFDMVIDDGGHSNNMMAYSLETIWNHADACLTARAVYAIEDMHTMAMCGGHFCNEPSDSKLALSTNPSLIYPVPCTMSMNTWQHVLTFFVSVALHLRVLRVAQSTAWLARSSTACTPTGSAQNPTPRAIRSARTRSQRKRRQPGRRRWRASGSTTPSRSSRAASRSRSSNGSGVAWTPYHTARRHSSRSRITCRLRLPTRAVGISSSA